MTADGMVLGSVHYMAPERVAGDESDGRADLCSLGVVAFERLSGRLPFDAPQASAVLRMHATRAVASLREAAPTVPAALAAVIEGCLAKDPRQRPQSGEALADALDAALRESQSGPQATRGPRMCLVPRGVACRPRKFRTFDISIIRGRGFVKRNRAGAPKVVVRIWHFLRPAIERRDRGAAGGRRNRRVREQHGWPSRSRNGMVMLCAQGWRMLSTFRSRLRAPCLHRRRTLGEIARVDRRLCPPLARRPLAPRGVSIHTPMPRTNFLL